MVSKRRGEEPVEQKSEANGGLRVERLHVGGEELAVLSYGLPSARLDSRLSDAEQEVAKALLLGRTNAEIAKARGSAVRTVANQVASILRKLGVQSRHDLALALERTTSSGS